MLNKVKKIQVVLLLLCAIAGSAYYVLQGSKAVETGVKFKSAPQFKLKDRTGREVKLDDFQGKLVVLHFWASWCPPCVDEIPKWIELARDFEGKNPSVGSFVQFVAVSLDKNWTDADHIFAPEKLPKSVVSLLDAEQVVPEAYGSFQYPETYLISPDARILTKWVGAREWNDAKVKAELLELVDLVRRPRK